jgi:hypothetical protein
MKQSARTVAQSRFMRNLFCAATIFTALLCAPSASAQSCNSTTVNGFYSFATGQDDARTLYFNGGTIYSNRDDRIGAYTVNEDCSLIVMLMDPLGTIQTMEGVSVNSGQELDLSAVSMPTTGAVLTADISGTPLVRLERVLSETAASRIMR